MKIHSRTSITILLTITLIATGCSKNENQRLAEMAERHAQRQEDQNRRMVEMQHDVAEGSRQLVEADAKARQEMAFMQREAQQGLAEVGRQRDLLEDDRRDLAAQRRSDPIIAAAIANVGLLLACLLPLILCWFLLRRPVEPADDQAVVEVLLEDVVLDQPLLLPPASGRRALGLRDERDTPPSSDDEDRADGAASWP